MDYLLLIQWKCAQQFGREREKEREGTGKRRSLKSFLLLLFICFGENSMEFLALHCVSSIGTIPITYHMEKRWEKKKKKVSWIEIRIRLPEWFSFFSAFQMFYFYRIHFIASLLSNIFSISRHAEWFNWIIGFYKLFRLIVPFSLLSYSWREAGNSK